MKCLLVLILSMMSVGLSAQNLCSDLTFEGNWPGTYTVSTISNWAIESQTATGVNLSVCPTPSPWVAGSPEFSLVATPILGLPYIGSMPHSPLGGTVVARINNSVGNSLSTKLSRTFSVTPTTQYIAYALAFEGSFVQHGCCHNPRVEINFRNANGAVIPCLSQTIGPECSSSFTTTSTNLWSGWQTYSVNLATQPSTLLTMEVITHDCTFGGHYMTCFFDAVCSMGGPGININTSAGDNLQRVSWCAGTSTAFVTAPPGIVNFTWSVPPTSSVIPANLSSTLLTVTNPSPNTTFTITTLSNQGCIAATVYTLVYTSVTLNPPLINSACGTQANGGVTLQPTGSSAGYSVTWYGGGAPVLTGLVNNTLSTGNYTVHIVTGAAGCGSVATGVFVPGFSQQVALNSNLFGLCSGQNTIAIISSSPALNTGNASFSWSPSTFLSSTNNISAVLSPSIAQGSSLALVYSVAVTPTAAPQCVFTVTAALNSSNPLPPLASVPPNACNNSAPFQVTISPAYQGTFTANPNNCISAAGMFSPSVVASGSCIFAYNYYYAGCSSSILDTIYLLPAPVLSTMASPSVFCLGQTATLSVSGAQSYSWSNGSSATTITVAPATSTVIGVIGSNTTGCASTGSVNLTVNPLPTISVLPDQLCLKDQHLLTAQGADTYSWSNGATGVTVQPLVSAGVNSIQVSGTNSINQCSNITVHTFTVYNPILLLSGDSVACAGAEFTVSASGCSTYTWNSGITGSTITGVSLFTQTQTYSVTGESNGCKVMDSVHVRIDECVAIKEISQHPTPIFFPNPSEGHVTIHSSVKGQLFVWDLTGRCIINKPVQSFEPEGLYLKPGAYVAGFQTLSGIQFQRVSIISP